MIWQTIKNRVKARPVSPVMLLDQGSVLWLLSVSFFTAVPHAEHLPLWLSFFAAFALLWRLFLWRQRASLPSRWILVPLVLLGMVGIALEFRTLLGKEAGVALLFFFMAMKPLEMRSQRDAMTLIMLGFFLLLTHYLFSESILTGLWLLVCALFLIGSLIRIFGSEQAPTDVVRLAGKILVQAIPFLVVLFILFPRVPGPLWGLPKDAHSGLSGLSEQMSPGSLSELINSREIAFRVEFLGQLPDRSALYWRGPVFEDFDGRTWRVRPHTSRVSNTANTVKIESHGTPYTYTTTLEAHNQRWLLALDMPVELPARSFQARTLEVVSYMPVVHRMRYRVSSVTDFKVNVDESSGFLDNALRLPAKVNPRTRQMADEWREKIKDPEKISATALQMFNREKFVYTLQPPLLGQHAVDEFLFDSRRGFCEHFASSYVFLMRAAGVPARVVAGYQGGEINPVDQLFVVRQSDAHAWAEIWVAGKGWIRVDPTAYVAPSRIEQGADAAFPVGEMSLRMRLNTGLLRALRYRWEAVGNAWDQWVVEYDERRQRELLSLWGLDNVNWQQMLVGLFAACAVLWALIWMSVFYRSANLTSVQHAWQKFCKKMAALGMPKQTWEGPLDYAYRIEKTHPELAAVVMEAARCYIDLNYGNGKMGTLDTLKRCRQELASIGRIRIEK